MMTKSNAVTAVVAVMAAALAACSSAEAPAPAKTTKSASSSSGGTSGTAVVDQDATEAEACVTKDAKPNDKGVGAYCDKTVRCGSGAFCTADFGAPVGAQFCTLMCEQDSDCGSGAKCFEETRGKGCVPVACLDEK